ncbi:hypothetical protein [Pseudomonas aeruginosa]|uniref:hypothetical protein n=1 Tax=Pseudomonas aeruginosa TaxID=287 RepID=UPI0002120584|nr:hypothetical protein [Pseudomonas aeruginosa]ERF04376.1 hypothetical protein PA13_1026880 [Pseudomonas aeruginosa HB13]ERZ10143.1 hypothetical protein Q008_04695 [Pseudomonas aeruginosa JJ692]KAF0591822.1 phosphoadenosine phosphosulfate reductase [Pseudomonas aeruginosa]KXC47707.1 hypothetical protein AW891_03135 [Pseudomonas aeruginosa]MBS2054713.1 hypothetical protein [Pseudomonas aeruginosa]
MKALSPRQSDIFAAGAQRLQMTESIELTIQSMQAYGADHEHWAVAWSGGKDSTTTLTLLIWLIDTGTWPDGWDGDEPIATTPLDKIFADGAVQPLLFC